MSTLELKRVLFGNALFSGVSGTILAIKPYWIAEYLEIPFPKIIQLVGFVLIGFAFSLIIIAKRELTKIWVTFVIIQDFLWILGTILILITRPFAIGMNGIIALIIVGLIVTTFMVLQIHYQSKRVDLTV